MPPSKPDVAGQNRYDEDMIAKDKAIKGQPLAHRKELRAYLEGIMEPEDLDAIYGKDTRPSKE